MSTSDTAPREVISNFEANRDRIVLTIKYGDRHNKEDQWSPRTSTIELKIADLIDMLKWKDKFKLAGNGILNDDNFYDECRLAACNILLNLNIKL